MYHDVEEVARTLSAIADYFSINRDRFARQLDLLQEPGLRGCDIAQALDNPARTVAISFDDGNLGQAVRAFPELAARRMSATFFVTTSWIGTPGYASWEQLREMRAAGMAIESHTHTHPFLSELDAAGLRDELRRSKDLLDERLGQDTSMLALPGGDAPKPRYRDLPAAIGYKVIATSVWGVNRSSTASAAPIAIRRCTIRGSPTDSAFLDILNARLWPTFKRRTRDVVLATLRRSLGPTRYARWRRRFLNSIG